MSDVMADDMSSVSLKSMTKTLLNLLVLVTVHELKTTPDGVLFKI